MIKLMIGAAIGFVVSGLCRAAKDEEIEVADMCPKCGGLPVFKQVGDNKEFWAVQCSNCGYYAANCNEAQMTPEAAMKLWNMKVKKEN